jgi:hypothetical protein
MGETHIDTFFDDPFLKAGHLSGDITVTMSAIARGSVGMDSEKEIRPLLSFSELTKPLVLNKTNAKRIKALYGSDTSRWFGKRITLYPTTCEFGGEEVECIRVRKEAPSPNDQPEKGATV